MKRHVSGSLVAVLTLILVVAGCAPAQDSTKANSPQAGKENEIKIGVIYPLTGNAAQAGQDSRDATQLAADIVNGLYPEIDLKLAKAGGIKGRKIKLIVEDHQGKPELGQSEAERLITQEKVAAILGGYFSSVVQPASQTAERLKTVFVTEASAPALTERGFKYFFRTMPSDSVYIRVLFDYMEWLAKKNNTDVKTVAFLAENTLWGQDSTKEMEKNAQRLGKQVVASISYPANSTNLDAEIQKLKAVNPDALFVASYTSDAILTIKTMKKFEWAPKIFLGNGAGSAHPDLIKNLGADAEGLSSRAAMNPDLVSKKPVLGQVINLFQKKYNRPIPDGAVVSFTSAYALFDAMIRAKDLTSDSIRQELEKIDLPKQEVLMPSWDGVKFDEKHQNIKVAPIIIQVQGGNFVTVYPENVAAGTSVFPVKPWNAR